MADKQVKIHLGFTADINQAKQQMNQLQSELDRLSRLEIKTPDGLTQGLTKANNEVLKLSVLLKECFNVNTGKLDINKFLVETQQYGMTWEQIRSTLNSFGSEGTQALQQLNAQIAQGQTRMLQLSEKMQDFAKQMKRTMSIQLSYGVMNSFLDTFRDAYSYAQSLNKSLTNIQIVTGKSSSEMRTFAVEANKAAKALSTSTTAYTDAALIYYQQGLNNEQVKERADTTIKLSNVTGQSAEEVSSYMTAIWNNFDDGSKKLEYYADVITALGAATASSSEEIAQGLSQFSAVADTVGLSYEYATAALATVVAQTRQSADTVGNAFKTIFARLESLNLGETLDDDTTLTKYTAALEKVGITVQLENGQLKNMDTILDELGSKWESINSQQKNALAYTVAGARQYTNFIALMDNWSKVQENIRIASGAEGTLQDQADIYAKSWEAASKRLKAAWQDLYDLLINDDFFITIIDGFSGMINGVNSLIKSLGGLKGLLPIIVGLATKLFSSSITKGITDISSAVKSAKNIVTGEDVKVKNRAAQALSLSFSNIDNSTGAKLGEAIDKNISQIQQTNLTKLTQQQSNYNELLIRKNQLLQENAENANAAYVDEIEKIQNLETEQERVNKLSNTLVANLEVLSKKKITIKDVKKSNISEENKQKIIGTGKNKQKLDNKQLEDFKLAVHEANKDIENEYALSKKIIENIYKNLQESYEKTSNELENNIHEIDKQLEALREKMANGSDTDIIEENSKLYNTLNSKKEKFQKQLDNLKKANDAAAGKFSKAVELTKGEVEGFSKTIERFANNAETAVTALSAVMALGASAQSVGNSFAQAAKGTGSWGTALSSLIPLAGTAIFAIKAVKAAMETLKIEIISFPVVGWIIGITTAIVGLIGVLNGLKEAKKQQWEEDQKNLESTKETITSIQKLSQSISDLIEKYKELREAGESSYQTFQDIDKQIPELIDKYKELGLNTYELEKAFNLFKITGDSISLELEKNKLDSKVANENYKNVIDTAKNGGKILASAGDSNGKGSIQSNDKYYVKFKGWGNEETKASNILKNLGFNAMKDGWWAEKTVNLNNTSKMLDYYENLEKARVRMEKGMDADELKNSGIYADVKQELTALKDTYNNVLNSSKQANNAIVYTLDNDNGFESLNKDLGITNVNLQTYAQRHQDIINKIAEENKVTEEDAKSILMMSDTYGLLARTYESFTNTAEQAQHDFGLSDEGKNQFLSDLNSWYDSLSVEDKQYALYPTLRTDVTDWKADFNKQIQEFKDQALAQEEITEGVKKGLEQGELEAYAEHLGEMAENSDLLDNSLKNNKSAMAAVAKDIMQMNRGIETLNDNYEDWIDILSKSDKSSQEFSSAMHSLQSALGDVYDISTEWITEDFINDHLKDIEKVAQGDAEAIEALRKDLSKDIIANILIENELENQTPEILSQFNTLYDQLKDIKVGVEIDENDQSGFLKACQDIIANAHMTAEQANAFFDAMGFETQFVTEPIKQKQRVPEYVTETIQEGTTSYTEDGKPITRTRTRTYQDGYFEAEGEVDAIAMTVSEDGTKVPQIKSITKTSDGAMNNFSSTNKGGKSGSKSNGKSSKREADRYYTISHQVEKLNKQLDELSKKTDRAFGQGKLDAMQAEIDKYNDLIAANKEYLNQAEEWLAYDRAKLEQYGAQFDPNGIITNYEAMFAAHGNEEDGEWAKWLSHYEDSLAKVQEMQKAIAEAQQAIYDKALEAIEYKLEFSLKINDSELKYLEYILNGLEDAAYDSAEAIATLEKKIDNANKKTKALNQNAVELFDIVSPGNGQKYYEQMLAGTLDLQALANEKILNDPNFNAAQWFDDINQLYEELIQNQEDYRQMWKDYIDMMKNFWDSWKENFDKQKKQITDLTKVAEFYKDLVGILGKDELGLSDATMARLDATVSKGRLDEALISYKTFLKAQKALQEAEEKGLDDEVIEYYKEKVQEAKDELMSAQKAAAQAFVDEYNNALDRIVKNAMDAFSNIGDFDWMKKIYDLELKRNDLYMDTYEKAYQMNKLNNDITRSINEIDGLKTKQELSSLLDEINAKQASGVKMSEYEYEAYRKEYELLLAIQALEDAKNAKNQVRMSRDSEGNMSYVYTADQDAIDAATDNYNDIAYQFAQLNMGQAANAEAQYLALYEQMMTEIREVGEEHRAEIEEKYAEMLKYWKDQAEVSYKWNKSLMDQMGLDYWDLTVKFEDSVLAHVTGCKTWEELEINRKETTKQALKEMADADQEYHDKVHDLLEETGLNVDNFEEQVNEDLDDINDGMDETMDTTEDLTDEFDDALDDMMDEAESFESKWDSTVKGVIAANDALIKSLGALIQQYNNLALAKSKATGTSYSGSVGSSVSDNTTGDHTSKTQQPDGGDPYKNQKYTVYVGSQVYRSGTGSKFLEEVGTSLKNQYGNNSKQNVKITKDGTYALRAGELRALLRDNWFTGFETGGYTGEWGPEGRLAMLHQKELVLNSDDTANMFQIIDAVRDVTNALELQSHGANVDLSGTPAGAMAKFMNFDQNVHITAEFPNATDRNEIQAAFADLMNRASQYINRK